jgi:hypothetical protein
LANIFIQNKMSYFYGELGTWDRFHAEWWELKFYLLSVWQRFFVSLSLFNGGNVRRYAWWNILGRCHKLFSRWRTVHY